MNESFHATHPGEVLKDELQYRNISQKDFAAHIGIPYTMLNDILNERRPLTETTALLVESALGISAEILLKLQMDYNLQKARLDQRMIRRRAQIELYSVA